MTHRALCTRACALTLVLATSLVTSAAHAAPPAGDPADRVREVSKAISDLAAGATDHGKMVADIQSVLAGMIDYDAFSARTLKGTWETLAEADRARFKDKFTALVTNTYAKRFKVGARFRVELRGATEWTGGAKDRAKVRTTVHGDKAAADVDYLFLASEAGGQLAWRAYDIIVDEVSMALNWRKQFKRIIDKQGFEALLHKIDKKVSGTK